MEFIIIFIFTNNKKEEKTLKFLTDEKVQIDENLEKYNNYIVDFFKEYIISDDIFTDTIKEYNEFSNNNETNKYLIFNFNIEEKLNKKEFDEFSSLLEIDENLYNLLNYKNDCNKKKILKNLYLKNNTEFTEKKKYNFIINLEQSYIQKFKEILKSDKIHEKIYFNTKFNNSIENIIKESQSVLFINF